MSWRAKATLRDRLTFKTNDRKPLPRSQSYTGPTTVGPDIGEVSLALQRRIQGGGGGGGGG